MFPDSTIASRFSCGEKKSSYIAIFGLGPYFADNLMKNLNSKTVYTLLFDESLNELLQEKQMDIHVRFWEKKRVEAMFLHSEFLGHATAEDLYDKLTPLFAKMSKQKLLHLSMDGPYVNLKLRQLLEDDFKTTTTVKMLDIGTCGLHVLHNAFRNGCSASGWGLESLFRAAYSLFDKAPARREDFIAVTKASTFPMQYCSHR